MRAVVLLAALAAACSKGAEPGQTAPSASASASVVAASPRSADAGAPKVATAGSAGSYAGTYSLAPAALYISDAKDFAHVKQVKDDPSKHVGDGTLSVEVDADGRIHGTIETGPASPAVIDGSLVGDELRGNVRRKTLSDDGLTGTLSAKKSGDAVEGKLSLAEANAAIVREGKLSLKKK